MKQLYLKLNNGIEIPQIGVILEGIEEPIAEKNVLKIIEKGFRHIKTLYGNKFEIPLGKTISKSGIKRNEICVSSTLNISNYGVGKTYTAISDMLNNIDLDYLDILYLAAPKSMMDKVQEAYSEAEKALNDGKIKGIALSIDDNEVIDDLMNSISVKPVILEVECHPWCQQVELKDKISYYGIYIESKYTIGHMKCGKFPITENLFIKLAEKYNKTPIQIAYRWHLQESNIVLPSGLTLNMDEVIDAGDNYVIGKGKMGINYYLKEFISVLDFELTKDEIEEIKKLDTRTMYSKDGGEAVLIFNNK